MRTLVLAYSRTGTTKRFGEALAARLGADFASIDCPRYDGPIGYVRAALASLRGHLPPIRMSATPSDYDCVLIGGPMWTSYPATPVRRILTDGTPLPQRTGVFLTAGGHSSHDNAYRLLDEIRPDLQATLIVQGNATGTPEVEAETNRFLAAMGLEP